MRSVSVKIFLIIGISIVFFSIFLLYRTYSISHEYVNELLGQQADLALTFDISIRKYVSEHIRPVMYDLLGEKEFMPETMSTSYVARSIFEDVQKDFPDVILKFSSDNPRNPANQASPEELEIIQYFNNNPTTKSWNGKISIGGREYLARFKARRMKKSCLHCHGDPADAPASLVERYGPVAGFHRPLGEVIAMDTIAIPLRSMHAKLWSEVRHNFILIGLGIVILFFTISMTLKFMITNRLAAISRHFAKAANQTDYVRITPVDIAGDDEIGALAGSYNTLADKLQGYYTSLKTQIKERSKANLKLKQEIEERKRAGEALRQAEEKYRGIFQNAVNGIFQCSDNGNLLSANPAFARMLGYDSPKEMATAITDIKKQVYVDPGRCRELLERLEQGPVSNFEALFYTKDGRVRWITLNVRKTRDPRNNRDLIEGMAQDVTEHKDAEEKGRDLEEQLLQAQKMDSIGRLAGGISHDFNNLLSAILGYSELALMDLPDDHPVAEHLSIIKNSGEKASALTRQLLAFSRKQILELRSVNLNDLVEDMAKMLRRVILENIALELNTKSPLGNVMADPGQIEQILMNLVINARDAMPDGGRIMIETEDTTLDQDYAEHHEGVTPGPYVMLAVTDTGEGMSREVQEKIFEPFFTTKERGKGTGLGLATVYGIVKQHKGHIWVYSEPGKGSSFKVYLPVARENREEEETDQIPVETPSGTETVMVVDDDPFIRGLIVDVLEPLGYHPLGAANGEEALEVSNTFEGEIDLLLTDVIMPKMNGKELSDKIKQKRPHTKVIFMSDYTDDAIVNQGVLHPGITFIQKPITREMLAKVVRKILDQEIPAS